MSDSIDTIEIVTKNGKTYVISGENFDFHTLQYSLEGDWIVSNKLYIRMSEVVSIAKLED